MPGTFVFKPIEATINNKATIGFHPENLDPYCKVKVGNVALTTHASRNFGPHPHWTDDLVIQQGEDSLCSVMIKDKNKGTIGEVKLDLDEIEAKGKVAQWYNICKDKNVQGQLLLEVVYTHANPQSRAFLHGTKEGAAISGNNTPFIKGHASPTEIPPFRIPATKHSHTAAHEMADIRRHLGANNIVARYALEHMKVPDDHTAVKHEIERQNARALNSSHKKAGSVVQRQYSPPVIQMTPEIPVTNKDRGDVKVHLGHNVTESQPSTTPSKSQVDKIVHSSMKEVANMKAHNDQLRTHPVYKATEQERLEASQHIPAISDTRRVKIIDKAVPATLKDKIEVAQHMGQPGHSAGHSSLQRGQVRVQRNEAVTGPSVVYADPIVDSYLPGNVNPGYAHSGHASLNTKGQVRVQRDGAGTETTVVYPAVDYVEENIYDVPVQENYVVGNNAHAGHESLKGGQVRVQRPGVYTAPVQENYVDVYPNDENNAHAGHASLKGGHVRVQRPGVYDVPQPGVVPGSNWVSHVQDNYGNVYPNDRNNGHAGHSSLKGGQVRVQRTGVYDAPPPRVIPGSHWESNVHPANQGSDINYIERDESVASSCTSCSAYEGVSNPNTVGRTREALKGVDRFNMVNAHDNDFVSVTSATKPGHKDDYFYLKGIGMSDPNTAKLGVNHSANRKGLADQKHHHHHHHHHHHGGVIVESPTTLADINTLGSGVRVRKY